MENYDAIGRWRKDQGGQPLDTKAQLPTGEKLNGSDELKRLLIQRKEVFLKNMTGQMLSYALGRQLQPADAATVNEVVADMQQNDNRFSVQVTDLVMSKAFRYRNSVPVPADPARTTPAQPAKTAAAHKAN